jgi:DNA-binding MarR family transcriptional regulator/GNAT superfamily N-acetyltransferase
MANDSLANHAGSVRHFNRFYTRRIGVLHEHLLDSAFSLTEVRIMYELAHRPGVTASELCRELGLNAGYLSRVITGFEKRGLIDKTRSAADARVMELRLTEQGRTTFEPLDLASQREIEAMLERLSKPEQHQLLEAMQQIEGVLEPTSASGYLLRDPLPGDMGWIVHRHGVLYAQEYGLNEEFEALVAEIVAKYVRHFDKKRERCWIAERHGKVVGSIFVTKQDDNTAKLRLLYVEPSARGLGIGQRLVDECVRFARNAGYQRMMLWTNSVLTAARKIYEKAGFEMIESEPHHSFGHDLVGEVWSLDL